MIFFEARKNENEIFIFFANSSKKWKATRNEHAILTKDNFQKKIFHKMGGQFAILCAMLLGNIAPKIFLLIPAVIGLFMA